MHGSQGFDGNAPPTSCFFSCQKQLHGKVIRFSDYLKQVLTLWEAFEVFNHSSIFDKAVFCLGEKKGLLVNDERSSWYDRVGIFKCRFGI